MTSPPTDSLSSSTFYRGVKIEFHVWENRLGRIVREIRVPEYGYQERLATHESVSYAAAYRLIDHERGQS